MSVQRYWSVEECRWETVDAAAQPYWSVQRCRWEPPGPAADALATPWSMFAARQDAAPAPAPVPEQRPSQPAPVEA